MPEFKVLYHPQVVAQDIPKLDAPVRTRIRTSIERKLTSRPEQYAKPLAYTRERLWSLRVGASRVVFAMREEELWILRIGHRSEVYKKLQERRAPE